MNNLIIEVFLGAVTVHIMFSSVFSQKPKKPGSPVMAFWPGLQSIKLFYKLI